MTSFSRARRRLLGWGAAGLVAATAPGAWARRVFPEAETTEFLAYRNGEIIGLRRMEIVRDGDDLIVHNQEELTLGPESAPRYRYVQRCEEVWRGGWLHGLVSDTREDERTWRVRAERDEGIFKGLSNGRQFSVSGYAITNTFWHRDAHSQQALLDVTDGWVKLIQGQLIGEERITVGHERRDSKHYLIAGQINRHLWYDLDCRLVRLRAPLRDGSEVLYEVPGGI